MTRAFLITRRSKQRGQRGVGFIVLLEYREPLYQYRKYPRGKKCWDTGSAVKTIDSGLVKVPVRAAGAIRIVVHDRLTLVLTG